MPSGACLYKLKSDESFMVQPARDGSPSGLNIGLILTTGPGHLLYGPSHDPSQTCSSLHHGMLLLPYSGAREVGGSE